MIADLILIGKKDSSRCYTNLLEDSKYSDHNIWTNYTNLLDETTIFNMELIL